PEAPPVLVGQGGQLVLGAQERGAVGVALLLQPVGVDGTRHGVVGALLQRPDEGSVFRHGRRSSRRRGESLPHSTHRPRRRLPPPPPGWPGTGRSQPSGKRGSRRSPSRSCPARGSPRPATPLTASIAPRLPTAPATAPNTGNWRRQAGGGSGYRQA